MAKSMDIQTIPDEVRKRVLRSFQSGHVNFLIGSGASSPAISTAGNIEGEVGALVAQGKNAEATEKHYAFLSTVWTATASLLDGSLSDPEEKVLSEYRNFLGILQEILVARRTNLLPRQIGIYSTNYDLFVEKASEGAPSVILNDGFARAPGLGFNLEFSSQNFSRSSFSTGNLYDYKVEIPGINLIKLHGSCNWKKSGDAILLETSKVELLEEGASAVEKRAFINRCAVVLPQVAKFQETTMDRTYYDLLRIFANTLDFENTVLVVIGFSFNDEHIRDIVLRALKNPTLRMMIFAYDAAARTSYEEMFSKHQNVEILHHSAELVDFEKVNSVLSCILRREAATHA